MSALAVASVFGRQLQNRGLSDQEHFRIGFGR